MDTERLVIRTKTQFYDNCYRWDPVFLLLGLSMSLNWGLSGMFLVAPAYISPSESNQTVHGFQTVQDEFMIGNSYFSRPEYVATAFCLGNFIMAPFLAALSDRDGRRNTIIFSIFAMGLMGIISAIMVNYETFLLARFIQGMFYSSTTLINWVVVAESTPPSTHAVWGVVFGMSWIFGSSMMAPCVMVTSSWRYLLILISVPNLILSALLFKFLPESLDFSLMIGDWKSLESYAKLVYGENIYKYEIDYEAMIEDSKYEKKQKSTCKDFILYLTKDLKFVGILLISCYQFFTSTLLHNAMALTSTVIEVGDVHWNFVLASLVEIPSYIFVPLLFNRIGNIKTLILFHILTALSNYGVVLVTPENFIPYLIFWLLAKFACSSAFMCFLIFSAQLYPTEYRNLCIAFCSTIGNTGAVFGPQAIILNTIRPGMMFTVFGTAALLAAFLSYFLPSIGSEDEVKSIDSAKSKF